MGRPVVLSTILAHSILNRRLNNHCPATNSMHLVTSSQLFTRPNQLHLFTASHSPIRTSTTLTPMRRHPGTVTLIWFRQAIARLSHMAPSLPHCRLSLLTSLTVHQLLLCPVTLPLRVGRCRLGHRLRVNTSRRIRRNRNRPVDCLPFESRVVIPTGIRRTVDSHGVACSTEVILLGEEFQTNCRCFQI